MPRNFSYSAFSVKAEMRSSPVPARCGLDKRMALVSFWVRKHSAWLTC